DSTAVTDLSTRAISSKQIAKTLPYDLYGGFLDLVSESPTPEHALEPLPLPEQSNGPHFFYGLQWWFFGALAVFGFFFLAWDERRRLREARASAQAPTVSSTN
ncbi:MAG TPA: SURF1 family protein, partial [Marmoricola sp.]|nr:SURF1 family protein [Marmoricola sp.]